MEARGTSPACSSIGLLPSIRSAVGTWVYVGDIEDEYLPHFQAAAECHFEAGALQRGLGDVLGKTGKRERTYTDSTGKRRYKTEYRVPKAAFKRGGYARAPGGHVNTYDSAADAEADRAQQLRLLAALGAWDRALRRDELAAWCIPGTRGASTPTAKGWVMHVACRSARHWSAVRAKLAAFTTITMDGDEEGVAVCTACQGRGRPRCCAKCWGSASARRSPPSTGSGWGALASGRAHRKCRPWRPGSAGRGRLGWRSHGRLRPPAARGRRERSNLGEAREHRRDRTH